MSKRKRKTQGPLVKNWCFTENNCDKLWSELPKGVTYVVHQLEKGKEGTLHVQGYLQLAKRSYLSAVKKLRPRAHWEPAKGTPTQNRAYCTKPEGRVGEPVELGDVSSQGKRTDLLTAVKAIKAGATKMEMFDSHFAVMARHRHLYSDIKLLIKPARKKRTVFVFYGDPRTGKTKYVWDNHPDHYSIPYGDKVWCSGYDAHDTVLWDDFAGRASKVPLTLLLQILDNYPLQLEVKGSHVWFNPSTLYITTNIAPSAWYDYSSREAHRGALSSRISELWTFTHKNVLGTDAVDHEIVKYKTQDEIKKFF